MPELPEVETVARELRRQAVGRTLAAISRGRKRLRQPWSTAWEGRLVGRRVAAVHRRGKWLLLELDGGGYLMVHLGMSGRFSVLAPEDPVEPHTHLVFRLDNQHELRFRDARRFGSVTYFPDRASWEAFLAPRLGPEPWDLRPAAFRQALAGSRRPVKAALLDQTVVAGIGNIYADEACFAARIDPRRAANTLPAGETARLLRAIRAVLNRAIESRGTTFDAGYEGGGYQHKLKVYGRKGEPCPRCRTPIQSVRLGGRSTHYCPRCQQ